MKASLGLPCLSGIPFQNNFCKRLQSKMNNQVKIGNYTMLNTIGTGTFGKVKMAVHMYTSAKVALKIVNRRRIVNLQMVQRLKREVQYYRQLKHPHIVKLYEVITTPTDIILVLEYANGELFNYIVEKGRMSEAEARKLFQQIICAIEHCHMHKIVHRDLKPENILMDANKNIKIADFGLSNYLQDGEFLKTSCGREQLTQGSPNYAAPEVISGKLYAGPEIDIWSCGIILYVMLCGQLPFDDEHIPTLFKKINSGVFRKPSSLSNGAKDLLSAMLTVDPLKRITIPEIRKHPWFAKDLPEYLEKSKKNNFDALSSEIDEQILDELGKKMRFSKETMLHALKEEENNQIKVAYQLSLRPAETTKTPSSIQVLSTSLPQAQASNEKKHSRSRWHYGIRSRSDPHEIMSEIYTALSKTSIKWKPVDSYQIKCVYVSCRGDVVKFEIQLYRIESGNYLVDFKRSVKKEGKEGNIFTFFNACTTLITELAVSG
ncbi:protein kinase, AMP-activated, alpha 2 catalytic subunit [Boothiomyces sp. JEL0866]|nr:protein kinase, AMP-activated, alpha 2 catalytic subunit [Boothiomyces sp. JEL0866]